MHRSAGRAIHTATGERTVPWYHLPTPLGVPTGPPGPSVLGCWRRDYVASDGTDVMSPIGCAGWISGHVFDGNNEWQDWFGGP